MSHEHVEPLVERSCMLSRRIYIMSMVLDQTNNEMRLRVIYPDCDSVLNEGAEQEGPYFLGDENFQVH